MDRIKLNLFVLLPLFSLLLVEVLTKQAHASFSLPAQFFGVNRISTEFRLPIKNKLLQLRQNFIEKVYAGGTQFISNKNTICPLGISVSARAPIVKYEYKLSTEVKNNEIITYENRFLKGCNQTDSLVEKFKVIGKRSYATSIQNILAGEYDFSMNDGKRSLDYRLYDGQGEQVIRLYSKIEGNNRVSYFYLGNEKYLQILYSKKGLNLDVKFKYFPVTFDLNRNGSQFRMAIAPRFMGFYRAFIYDDGAIEYYNDRALQISLASFQQSFGLSGVSFIMDSMLIELPATKFITTGNQSARLTEELRNAQNWLIQGGPAQINLVRNLVQEYLDAVQNGLIIDKRPRNQ